MNHDYPTQAHDHQSLIGGLDHLHSLNQKVAQLHGILVDQFPPLQRITVAVYDERADLLKTFCCSDRLDNPLRKYAAPLAASPSLQSIAKSGRPRVVDDLATYDSGRGDATQWIVTQGYRSSYTMPMLMDGRFAGLIFFDATEPEFFKSQLLFTLDPFAHLIALTVIRELAVGRTLQAAVKTARSFAEHRDSNTGAHLDRMSRYARLIALELAEEHALSDEAIEFIFLFAPLHDIGKIGIPDSLLLKPGKLTEQEFELMKRHVDVGRQIVDSMIADFGFDQFGNVGILRNIVHHHHEAYDGSGYPDCLAGEAIPVEARIVAVADIFDALTSRRPYKRAWGNDEALGLMEQLAGTKLDPRCLDALRTRGEEIALIQQTFEENPFG